MLPWVGFFHKMTQADVFVILDNVRVSRGRSYASRTMIKTEKGPKWLSVPLARGSAQKAYCSQSLPSTNDWSVKIADTIRHNYARAPFYERTGFFEAWEWALFTSTTLAEFNVKMIMWARRMLKIDTRIEYQSWVWPVPRSRENLAIDLCGAFGCNTYLSGVGGAKYNDEDMFKMASIELKYQQFECPEYPQEWGEFTPNLSIIDLLFNCGPESAVVLNGWSATT
jgi:hypothetical protein